MTVDPELYSMIRSVLLGTTLDSSMFNAGLVLACNGGLLFTQGWSYLALP